MKVTVNSRPIKLAAQKAFKDTVLILEGEFTKAITDPVYPWPTGESPRDIVDTGTLRRSQQYRIDGKLTAFFIWNTEYAAAVHNGAVLRNGGRLNARKWTEVAIKRRDPLDTFGKLYKRYAE